MRRTVAVIEAVLFLVAVYFEPTHVVRGKLWGEAFFEGRPTSYWRCELDRWYPPGGGIERFSFSRNPTWFERKLDRWVPTHPTMADAHRQSIARIRGPRLLHGDAAAIPVLQALLDDSSPKLRQFARIGLKLPPETP